MDFTTWLRTWLARHPLKGPAGIDRARYTAEVMGQVKTGLRPALLPARHWLPVPRWGLAAAVAAAGLVVAIGAVNVQRRQLAEQAMERTRLLAESAPTEERWLDQTLDLIDQLNEGGAEADSDDASEGLSDDDWLNELELLDQAELSASS